MRRVLAAACAAWSNLDKQDGSLAREEDVESPKLHQRLRQRMQMAPPPPKVHQPVVAGHVVLARETTVDTVKPGAPLVYGAGPSHVDDYFRDRDELVKRGGQLGFSHRLAQAAGEAERGAKALIDTVRFNDGVAYYARGEPLASQFDGQRHGRFAGDHFLTNAELIKQTGLYKVARRMPKGAHLHIHFNSCLLPHVLLDIAAGMKNMFMWSTRPLTSAENLDLCEIQFEIRGADKVAASDRGDLFGPDYRTGQAKPQVMRFQDFMRRWDEERATWKDDRARFTALSHQQWLVGKLVFSDSEAHDPYQTPAGYVHPRRWHGGGLAYFVY